MADNLDNMTEDFGMEEHQEGEVDFYTAEVARYEAIASQNLEESFKRYGFTLYHSLPALKQVELGQTLGFSKRDATDYYNAAGLDISRDDFSAAAKNLQKALELDGTMADAAHNLALCYERLNRKPDALSQWNRFMELTDCPEDKIAVEAHVAELKAAE